MVTLITQTALNFNWREEAYILSKSQIVSKQLSSAHAVENRSLLSCIAAHKDGGLKKKKKKKNNLKNRKSSYSIKYGDYFKLPGRGSVVADVQLYILPQTCFKKTECKMCMSHIEEG